MRAPIDMRDGGSDGEDTGELVTLVGRIDAHSASQLRERLHRAVDGGAGMLVLDMSSVELIDATGLGVLVGASRRALRADRQVVLRGAASRLCRLLRVTRLDRLLPAERPSDGATFGSGQCSELRGAARSEPARGERWGAGRSNAPASASDQLLADPGAESEIVEPQRADWTLPKARQPERAASPVRLGSPS
ncbi:MAG: STAS domain-containing protein [Micromonosporaceae bacterium]